MEAVTSINSNVHHSLRGASGTAVHLLFLSLLLLFLPFPTCRAQFQHPNSAFQAGEDLHYDLYFNWHFIWVKAGTAHYTVRAATYQQQPALRTDLLFQGSPRLNAVFPMQDTLRSYTTPSLQPLYFRKGATEGKRYTVDEVFYTYPNGRSHVEQHHKNRQGQWSEHHYESNDCNYDMLSILNVARSFDPSDWKTGHRLHFPMATGKRVEPQTLIFRGRKKWKANDGITYRCLVFTLLDYDEKDTDKELLRFYVTDDKNHLPVRIDFYLRFGIAKAFYAKGIGIRNPQTSILKKIQMSHLLPHYHPHLTEAGCDEAGRGCLAGSVYAAAVILPEDYENPRLNDSKQLTARQRYLLRSEIKRDALSWAVGIVTAEEIDKINILRASILAMHRALDQLTLRPQAIIVDGNRFRPYHDLPYQTIVKGDGKYLSIAAASILAKTYRDDYMHHLAEEYPQYGWQHNAGYPTRQHRAAIAQYGLTPYHRRTFNLLGDTQLPIPFPTLS